MPSKKISAENYQAENYQTTRRTREGGFRAQPMPRGRGLDFVANGTDRLIDLRTKKADGCNPARGFIYKGNNKSKSQAGKPYY